MCDPWPPAGVAVLEVVEPLEGEGLLEEVGQWRAGQQPSPTSCLLSVSWLWIQCEQCKRITHGVPSSPWHIVSPCLVLFFFS